jgi:hypothetical protein
MRDRPRLVACGFGNSVPGVRAVGRQGTDLGVTATSSSGIFPVRCAARSDNIEALAHTDLDRRVLADPPAVARTRLSRPIVTAGFRRAFGCFLEAPQDLLWPQSCRGDCVGREWVANTQVIDIPCRDRPDWRAFCSCGNAATETTACGLRTSPDCRSLAAVVDPSGNVLATNNWTEVSVRAQPRRLRNGGLSGRAVLVRSRRTGKRNDCRSWGVEYDKQARPLT